MSTKQAYTSTLHTSITTTLHTSQAGTEAAAVMAVCNHACLQKHVLQTNQALPTQNPAGEHKVTAIEKAGQVFC